MFSFLSGCNWPPQLCNQSPTWSAIFENDSLWIRYDKPTIRKHIWVDTCKVPPENWPGVWLEGSNLTGGREAHLLTGQRYYQNWETSKREDSPKFIGTICAVWRRVYLSWDWFHSLGKEKNNKSFFKVQLKISCADFKTS